MCWSGSRAPSSQGSSNCAVTRTVISSLSSTLPFFFFFLTHFRFIVISYSIYSIRPLLMWQYGRSIYVCICNYCVLFTIPVSVFFYCVLLWVVQFATATVKFLLCLHVSIHLSINPICTVRTLKPQSDKGWMIILFLYKKNQRRVKRCRRNANSKKLNEIRTSDSIKQLWTMELPFLDGNLWC